MKLFKHWKKTVILFCIFSLWIFMMALLLQREYFPYRSTKIQQNYKETVQKLQEIDVAKVVKMDIFHSIFKNRYKI